jgi:FKBP-type peptidyl-prolyl cis-trans isomerase 2
MVIVDTNHRRAGQALELEVELISIRPRAAAEGQRPAAPE